MFVFYDPTPESTNPDTYRVLYTAQGEKDVLTAGQTNWIEVADQEVGALEGWVVQGGALVLVTLAPYRRDAIARVNRRAGEKRLEFITDIPGQQMLYQEKEAEARAWLATVPPPLTLSAFPLMAAEVGIGLTAATPLALAQLWTTMGTQWRTAAALIENARLSTIYAIEIATDIATIDGTVAAFEAAMAQ